MTIALVTLTIRKRDLIPRYGSGVTSIHNLDAMMHNSGRTIDAVRSDGRIGYNREARKILAPSICLKPSIWLNRHLRIRWSLSWLLTNRFELLICRRAALEELRHYNAQRLTPLFGERICTWLDEILDVRINAVDRAIQETKAQFGATHLTARIFPILLIPPMPLKHHSGKRPKEQRSRGIKNPLKTPAMSKNMRKLNSATQLTSEKTLVSFAPVERLRSSAG